jgi:hypothetical protein
MKLLIMQSSQISCHFLPLRSKYSSQHLFSDTHTKQQVKLLSRIF